MNNSDSTVFDVCIVGAGAAGIVIALELAAKGKRVCLTESGERHFNSQCQSLGDEAFADHTRHAPMRLATRRQIGGATNIWGGRIVPYDPIDFERREHIPYSNWPITYDDVARYHQRACDYFFCGDSRFSTQDIPEVIQKTIIPSFEEGKVLASSLERWSLPTNFRAEYYDKVINSPRIDFVANATCVELEMNRNDTFALKAHFRSVDGKASSVQAKQFVVACGGLESTRLLLCSGNSGRGLGNAGGCLGRFYMGHLSGRIAQVQFSSAPHKTQYGFLRDREGVYLRPRFSFSREAQLAERICNTAIWLVNPDISDARHANGAYSLIYLILASPLGKYCASEAIRRSALKSENQTQLGPHLVNVLKDFPKTAFFAAGFGVRRFLVRRKIPGFFQYSAANRYLLHYHAEQVPNPESQVTLSDKRDLVGMRRLSIDFRFQEQDVESVIRAHEILDAELRRQRLGKLDYLARDLREAIWDQASDGYHQCGTTRMSSDPSCGVVDEQCKVHGVDNLYVASGSVFATSGQANTTFLVVALALRLVSHIMENK